QSEVREVALATDRGGAFHLGAQFDVQISPHPAKPAALPARELSAQARADALRSTQLIQADSKSVQDLLQQLRGNAAGEADLVVRLFKYCASEIAPRDDDAPEDAADVIAEKIAAPGGRSRALVALCRAAKVPARLVTGFEVKEGVNVRPRLWAEVHDGRGWVPYDPEDGFSREMPPNFLPVQRDTVEIVRGTHLEDLRATFSIIPIPPPPGVLPPGRHHPVEILDLTRLPWRSASSTPTGGRASSCSAWLC
ncbi:MAG: transglutaminase family protein, partial [Planctomycetota bacterium]|nr:transglutaminase family protein [Planctomycetota bacterium]